MDIEFAPKLDDQSDPDAWRMLIEKSNTMIEHLSNR